MLNNKELFEHYSQTRVESFGDLKRKILFIGEAPADIECKVGEPFVGRAGKQQDHMNNLAGIQRDDARWTNVSKVRMPGDDITFFIDLSKKPSHEDFLSWISGDSLAPPKGINPLCLSYVKELFREIEMFSGNVIVPLGNVPLWVLTGLQHITKRRGSILSARGRKIIPCVHPSAILRSFSLIEQKLAIIDLQRVKEESKTSTISFIDRTYRIYPTFEDAMLYIEAAFKLPQIGFDIEVMKTALDGIELSCFGIAHSSVDAMCVPLISKSKNVWSESDEVALLETLSRLLEDQNVVKIGQNLMFDSNFMYRKYGMIVDPVEDTMLAHAIRYPDFMKGLDFLTRFYTREPYYKDEGKEWGSTGGEREAEFFTYNCKDACFVLEIFPKIIASIEAQDRRARE